MRAVDDLKLNTSTEDSTNVYSRCTATRESGICNDECELQLDTALESSLMIPLHIEVRRYRFKDYWSSVLRLQNEYV